MIRSVTLALTATGLILAARADACMPAPPRGKAVEVADEAAVIVWDAEKKVEHFIRRANFRTDADDMGFVVPTPGKPELEEVDNSVFGLLESHTAPRIIYSRKPDSGGGFGCGAKSAGRDATEAASSGGRVEVISEKELAGQKATVLSADDAGALRRWLEANNYPVSDAMEAWAKYYVEKKWYFTAFRYLKSAKSNGLGFAAVRMSFPTDVPVYPYKEPAVAKTGASRTLKVFFLTTGKVEGVQNDTGKAWAGVTEYAKPAGVATAQGWYSLLKVKDVPDKLWLTEMIDRSNPRPATGDIEFRVAAEQSEKERTPIYAGREPPHPLALASIGLMIVGALGLWMFGRYAGRRGF